MWTRLLQTIGMAFVGTIIGAMEPGGLGLPEKAMRTDQDREVV